MQQKILKSGNSLVVGIPSELVRILGLKTGQTVITSINYSEGIMQVTFPQAAQLPLIVKK